MNLGQIRTAVRLRLQDTSERVWTDTTLDIFINDSLNELTKAEAMLKRYRFPLVDGQRTYNLPKDLYELRGVKLNNRKIFGTHANLLEELDAQYLTQTDTPYMYYLQDLLTLAFYPVPTWTDDYTEFESASGMVSGENGVITQFTVDSTDASVSAETGVVLEIIDDTLAQVFVVDPLDGEAISLNDAPFICDISYAYKPQELVADADTPDDLPVYMHDAMVFYAVAGALGKEGQGQDKKAEAFWFSRYEELQKEWFARNVEWARGEDQFASQRPVSWGDDLETRIRVWP
jgi:hypothetical protein